MTPALQRAAVFAAAQLRRLTGAIRQHPFRSALALPALMLLYGLVLLAFTPSIGDLRKAKSEAPSVLLASDGNQLRFQGKVVGQKHQTLSRPVLHHPALRDGVTFARKIGLQYTGLIAQHRSVDSINRMRVAPSERGVALVSGHKEGLPARTGRHL